MDATVKQALDLRLAKGEISIEEYNSIVKHIQAETASYLETPERTNLVKSKLNSAKKNDDIENSENISPSHGDPYEVTKDFTLFESSLFFEGKSYEYNSILSLLFISVKRTTNFITTNKNHLAIIFDNAEKISIKSTSMLIEGNKFKSINNAYSYLSAVTFKLRLKKMVTDLDANGVIERDGVKIYKNSKIQKGNTLVDLKVAKKNNCLEIGSRYDNKFGLSSYHLYQPNRIIIGEKGTSLFSKRVAFDSVTDKDIIPKLILHLAE